MELGVGEHTVRRYRDLGELEVVRPGDHGRSYLFDPDSVHELKMRLRYGPGGKDVRTVMVHHSLERERLALEVSGLVAVRCDDVVHALDHRAYHRPILVWPDHVEGFEQTLFDKFVTRVYAVVIGQPERISQRAKQYASWVEPGELRELTIHAWNLVDRRHKNAMLRL